jgi:proteasome lid subunit RPN8/RPN11
MRLQTNHIHTLISLMSATGDEVCGILVGQRTPLIVIDSVVPAQNVHSTPRSHFLVDAATLLQTDAQARVLGREIIGFFHSHPTGDALPSLDDRRDAWPDCVYAILARTTHGTPYLCAWLIARDGSLRPEPIMPNKGTVV